MTLVDRLLAGEPRALPRLVSLVEAGTPAGEEAVARLFARTGQAHVIGVTGPPGVGKSTLVNAMIGALRADGRRVGVVAVDPSSPLSGGAVLGDRIRMMERHGDDGVFIRSMASRGQIGGVAVATVGVVHLLDAAGFPVVLIETVGVGQDAVEIASLAHTVVVVQAPGLGDGVQSIKAGLLEIADLLVVNKADQPGAEVFARQLRQATEVPPEVAGWRPPVLLTTAATGAGVADLMAGADAHRAYLRGGEGWRERNRTRARAEIQLLLRQELARRLDPTMATDTTLDEAVDAVAARQASPREVVGNLLDRLTDPAPR